MDKLSKLQKSKQFLSDHFQFRKGPSGDIESRLCLHKVVWGDFRQVNFNDMWYLVAHQFDVAPSTVEKAIRSLAVEHTANLSKVYPEHKR